jgi:hypothetical protein
VALVFGKNADISFIFDFEKKNPPQLATILVLAIPQLKVNPTCYKSFFFVTGATNK